jgi:anti-sigma B factor antagonist
MDDTLTLVEERDDDVSIIRVDGEVDMQTMKPLRELLRRIPNEGIRYIILDFSDVGFLDSAGMSLLFSTKKRVSEDRGECYLITAGNRFVEKTLQTIELDKVMPHLTSVDAALADIRERKAAKKDGSRPEAAPHFELS